MAHLKTSEALSDSNPLPFEASQWEAITIALAIPPQEAKVVELVLRGLRDKQIAVAVGIAIPTVRTYLQRTYARMGVTDRLELVLRIVAVARNLPRKIPRSVPPT